MKMMKTMAAGIVAFSLSASAWAGTPAPPSDPMVEESTGIGASVGVGYDSSYIFRGVKFAEHSVWGSVDYSHSLSETLSLDLGTWYETSAADQYDELNVYASLGTSVSGIDVSLGFLWYYFPPVGGGDDSDTQEVFYTLGKEIAGIGIEFTHAYDFVPDGHYLALSASKSIELTDKMSLDLSAGISYNIDYFLEGDGFNNVDIKAALPIALTSNVTLEPYIAYSHALEALEDEGVDDYLYGGVSLSVGF